MIRIGFVTLVLGISISLFPAVTLGDVSVVATVTLQNTKIKSQEGNTSIVEFDLNNRIGAQGQIKYGIYLTQATSTVPIASTIYDETISISENETKHREVSYDAPSYLPSGTYNLIVEAMNTEGLPLAYGYPGSINVTRDSAISYVTINCTRAETKDELVSSVIAGDRVRAVCDFISDEDATLKTQSATYKITKYGEQVASSEGETFGIQKGTTTKTFTVEAATVPGSYELVFGFTDIVSLAHYVNAPLFYTVQGVSASIINAVFDKDIYEAGELAELSVLWTQAPDTFEAASMKIDISSPQGSCAPTYSTGLVSTLTFSTTSIPITSECISPVAKIAIYDKNNAQIGIASYGVTHIQKDKEVITATSTNESVSFDIVSILLKSLEIIGFGALVALLIVLVRLRIRIRIRSKILTLLVCVSSSFSFFVGEASADTLWANGWPLVINPPSSVIHANYYDANVSIAGTSVLQNYNGGQWINIIMPNVSDMWSGYTFAQGSYYNSGPGSGFFNNFNCSPGSGYSTTFAFGSNGAASISNVLGTYTTTFDYKVRVGTGCSSTCGASSCSGATDYTSSQGYSTTVVWDGNCSYPGATFSNPYYVGNSSGGCNYGSKINASSNATSFNWQCTGSANGGSTVSCAEYVPDASCGSAHNTNASTPPSGAALCGLGSATSVTDQGSYWYWYCNGTYLKNNDVSCVTWKTVPAVCGNGTQESGESCDLGASNGTCPSTCSTSCTVNSCVDAGSCGTAATSYITSATAYSGTYCATPYGNSGIPAFPSAGNSSSWYCKNSVSLNDAYCTATRAAAFVAGTCGTAATSYASGSTTYSGTFCSTGAGSNPASPAFPVAGNSTTWNCRNSDSTAGPNCTASRAAASTNLISTVLPTIASGSLFQGTNATFNGTVQNDGATNVTTAFSDNFTYCWGSACSPATMIGGHIGEATLNSTASRIDTSSSFSLSNAGILRVQHCIDSQSQITESSETVADNCKTADFTVADPNILPVANAGADWYITLPTNSVNISGASASDSDSSVASTVWSKVSGPAGESITNGNTLTPTFGDMNIDGVYVYRLTVTDNQGGSQTDDMSVFVNPIPQCADGIDNDGDGFIDMLDSAGCVDGSDTDETDVFPPPTVTINSSANNTVFINPNDTVTVGWDTNNGNETLCTLTTSTNPDNIGNVVIDPLPGAVGSELGTLESDPITVKTRFTITCAGLTDSTVVELIPSAFES